MWLGCRQIMRLRPEVETVFLAPPSWDVLVERLRGRGTESDEVINRRLETARTELDAQGEFRHVVVNDNLETALAELTTILLGE